MKNKTLEETMMESIPKMMEYMQEFKQGQKPLGNKAKAQCRAFMHKTYAPLVSWMTTSGIDWNENEANPDEVKQQIEKTTSRFGPKTFTLAQEQVEKWQKSLIKKEKYDIADRLPDTMFVSAQDVLTSDLGSAISFSCKNKSKEKASEKTVLTA